MKTVFDNGMTAHVWAQATQSYGRSNNNGNVYFEGPTLFSYGPHFVTGFLIPTATPADYFGGCDIALTLITGDSYSVSTSGHVSDARAAARGPVAIIPGLTELTRIIRRHAWRGAVGVAGDMTPAPMKERREALPAIRDHFAADPASDSAMVAVFRAMGATPKQAATWARMAREKYDAAERARKERDARAERDRQAERARALAARPVADTLGLMRETLERPYFSAERAESEWRETARGMFRAMKEAKARGWTRIAADIAAHRKTVFAFLPEFERREAYINRRRFMARNVADIRAAQNAGEGVTAQQARAARQSFLNLADAEFIAPRALLVGVPNFAERMTAAADALGEALPGIQARERRARVRAEIAALRAGGEALATVARALPDDAETLADIRATLADASRLAGQYARPQGMPAAVYHKAGFDIEQWERARRLFRAGVERVDSVISGKIHAVARAAWRQSGHVPADVVNMARRAGVALGAGYYGTRLDDGEAQPGALLRAADVERDATGAIVGGVLHTSQAASVPLVHAIRVFRFLKRCRATATEWRANGKTLPVGHFRVERVTADGAFKAGCHWINWGEVARVADALGLADIADADTTEERATA